MGLALVEENLGESAEKQIRFEDFYAAYPRKQNRKMAALAWKRVPASEHQAIMQSVETWKKSDQWQRGIIPLPSTFLNCERWTDEVDVDIQVNYCKWRGCAKPATTVLNGTDYCEQHNQARKRGETPV